MDRMPLPPSVLRTHTHTLTFVRVYTRLRKHACSTHNTEKKRRLVREEEKVEKDGENERWKTAVKRERKRSRGEGGGEEAGESSEVEKKTKK